MYDIFLNVWYSVFRVGLTVVNVRTVKNAQKLNENVMQNYFSIGD